MNSVLGMLIFSVGGLAGATFLLPARGVKGWAYETWWMFYCVVGLLLCPPVICAIFVPDFWNVTMSASAGTLLQCAGFGAIWGIGGLTWGLMVRYLGIGLGLAIGCGLCAATGTLIPPIAQGRACDLVKDTGAIIVLAGVVGSLVGIGLVGYAGKLKENELPEEEKKKAVADFNFKKGMVVALISGVASACMNFGLQSGGSIEKAAYVAAVKAGIITAGAMWSWQGMPVIMVVLWGGFIVQAAWVVQQHIKNGTAGDYFRCRPKIAVAAECKSGDSVKRVSLLSNWIFASLVGVIWVFQFVCQKAGEPLLGDLKYISFAVVMASTIFFSTLIGVFLGEWKGVGSRTKAFLTLGTLILVASFCVISIGSK